MAATRSTASPYNGVADNSYPYATIKNGAIDGFTNAVYLHAAPDSVVTSIVARNDPGVAISVDASPFTTVSKAAVVAYGYEGVYLQADGSTLTGSSVSAASNPVGTGVVVWGSGDTVSGVTISASAKAGILVQYGGGNHVTKSRVEGAGSDGIRFYDTQGATVSGNTVTGSAGVGILVEATSDGTALTKNTVSASAADGIEISTDSLGSLITGNTSNGNRSSGIDVENSDPSSKLGKNGADYNALDGIIGAVGTTDLGGNQGRPTARPTATSADSRARSDLLEGEEVNLRAAPKGARIAPALVAAAAVALLATGSGAGSSTIPITTCGQVVTTNAVLTRT